MFIFMLFSFLYTPSISTRYAHFCELRGRSSNNLLHSQLSQLGLQFSQLLMKIILALGPERTSLDFSGRLSHYVLAHASSATGTCILTILRVCRVVVNRYWLLEYSRPSSKFRMLCGRGFSERMIVGPKTPLLARLRVWSHVKGPVAKRNNEQLVYSIQQWLLLQELDGLSSGSKLDP